MAERLKRWESPRKEGRNRKGRGGSARQRQRYKQTQCLRRKLKATFDPQTEYHQVDLSLIDLSPQEDTHPCFLFFGSLSDL